MASETRWARLAAEKEATTAKRLKEDVVNEDSSIEKEEETDKDKRRRRRKRARRGEE